MNTRYNNHKLTNVITIIMICLIVVVGVLLFINLRDDPKPLVTIDFGIESLNIYVDDVVKTNLTLTNNDPSIKVIYKSNNESVATVDSIGTIRGISTGITEIIATYTGEKGNSVSDKLLVIVNKVPDKTIPKISYEFINGTSDVWNNSDVIIKISATDDERVKSLKYAINCSDICNYIDVPSDKMVKFSDDGEYLINVSAADESLNKAIEVISFKIDKTKPTVSYSVSGGTYYENKTVVINSSDTLSGVKEFNVKVYKNGVIDSNKSKTNIASSSYSVSLNSDATWKIVTYITDNASNVIQLSSGEDGYMESYIINVNGYREGPGGDRYSKTIIFNGRTYKIFKQAKYRDVSFWGDGDLADNGCAPCSTAIVLSGYRSNITPVMVADVMQYGTFDRIEATLKHFGMNIGGYVYYNSNDRNEERVKAVASQVRAHLKKGKPLIALVSPATNSSCSSPNKYSAQNHFIAILGEKANGELIIGQSGSGGEGGTLENLIRCYLTGGGKGFLFIEP